MALTFHWPDYLDHTHTHTTPLSSGSQVLSTLLMASTFPQQNLRPAQFKCRDSTAELPDAPLGCCARRHSRGVRKVLDFLNCNI